MNYLPQLIQALYQKHYDINQDVLREILAFGEEAVPYLEEILAGVMENPEKEIDFAVLHTLFLLGDLRWGQSLPKILRFLTLPAEYLEQHLGEFIFGSLCDVLCVLGKDRLHELKDFILNKNFPIDSRIAVGEGLREIALNFPEKKPEVFTIFRKILLSPSLTDDEKTLRGMIICDIMDCGGEELEKEILDAFKNERVDREIVTENELDFTDRPLNQDKVPSDIFQRYDQLMKIEAETLEFLGSVTEPLENLLEEFYVSPFFAEMEDIEFTPDFISLCASELFREYEVSVDQWTSAMILERFAALTNEYLEIFGTSYLSELLPSLIWFLKFLVQRKGYIELNAALKFLVAHLKTAEETLPDEIEDEIIAGLRFEDFEEEEDYETPADMEAMSDPYGNVIRFVRKDKVGRNDPCPCGSGKKYKKCCLNR